jgi:hypothetical protein
MSPHMGVSQVPRALPVGLHISKRFGKIQEKPYLVWMSWRMGRVS